MKEAWLSIRSPRCTVVQAGYLALSAVSCGNKASNENFCANGSRWLAEQLQDVSISRRPDVVQGCQPGSRRADWRL